ncbi:MAG: zinc-binding dehydrogenase, partial [Alcaligenes sp.]
MYLGVRLALEAQLRLLAAQLPAHQRLRVLEVAVGPSELPKTLAACLSEDRFDYVLALADPDLQARQKAEYQNQGNVQVAAFDLLDWQVSAEADIPHRTVQVRAALARTRAWLAAGGVLAVAECHPDWHADLLAGLDVDWWHAGSDSQASSSLLSPEGWRRALEQEGFEQEQVAVEPAAQSLAEGAYLVLARNVDGSVARAPAPAAAWLLLADAASQELAERLRVRLQGAEQNVRVASLPLQDGACPLEGKINVVHMLGWDDTAAQAAETASALLELVQSLARQPSDSCSLWVLTRGGAMPAGGQMPEWAANPAQSSLWGFGRVIMNEYPALSCALIDLAGDAQAADLPARLESELLWPDGANEIVLSEQARHTLVLKEAETRRTRKAEPGTRFRLDFHVPGQLRNLEWLATEDRALADDEIEVRTMAAGLNFRDVMYLMGLLPDEAVENGFAGASLGLEFSGVISRIGAKVKHLSVGQPVMGFGSSCFASHVTTRADAVAPIPEGWSYNAAATVPTVFFTVYYALTRLADLQPGEKVLIHGAAGGVGIAAIQLARHLGAEIYATAGSDEKRVFASLLGADHVFDSRSLSFAQDVLDATGGEGVDVVLNSLAGEAMRRSLDVLRPFGRFLELGKRDFFENTPIGLRPFKSNISYFGIDADQLLTGRPALAARLFQDVMRLFHDEALFPLPYRTFAAERVVDAFRAMQQARH